VAALGSADKFAVASPRVLEADAAPVELAVKFGEAVLGNYLASEQKRGSSVSGSSRLRPSRYR